MACVSDGPNITKAIFMFSASKKVFDGRHLQE